MMDEDEDTVMGDSHTLSTLTANPSFTGVPLPTHLSNHPTPSLAPSSIPQAASASLSPGSEQSQPREATASTGMAPPERFTKTSDGDSSAAEQLLKRDSLIEPESDWSDDEVMAKAGLPLASLATGLCYDHRMRYHCEVRPQSDVHPEDPRRIYYIYKELCRAGLVDDPESSRPLAPKTLERINARNATEEEVTLIHKDAHYAFVRSTKGMSLLPLEKLALIRFTDSINRYAQRGAYSAGKRSRLHLF